MKKTLDVNAGGATLSEFKLFPNILLEENFV
jgi:hypothetical protein